jgi:hypothetical protein
MIKKGIGMYEMNCSFKQTEEKISIQYRTFHSGSISFTMYTIRYVRISGKQRYHDIIL